jgi:citronellol/citronellal dehydrogenase
VPNFPEAEMRLDNRVAIVTGGSRGIGKAVCLALAREGCNVVVAAKTDTPSEKLPGTIQETAREVEALGRRALPIRVNVREDADIAQMVEATMSAFGRVDILINNAGAIGWSEVADTPASRFDLMMDVNARAAFLCSRAVLPHMIAAKWGHIVMMSPPLRFGKLAGKTAYLLSKMGMTFIAKGIAQECAEHGVAANSLWPMTMIESQATIHFQLGEPSQWRTAQILADATVEICCTDPGALSGQELYDEDVLRRRGTTDFAKYRVVPNSEPEPLCKTMVE